MQLAISYFTFDLEFFDCIFVNLRFYIYFSAIELIVFDTFLMQLYRCRLRNFQSIPQSILIYFCCSSCVPMKWKYYTIITCLWVCVCGWGGIHTFIWDTNPCSKASCNVLREIVTSSRIPGFYKEVRAGVKHFTHREEEKEPTWNIRSETKTWWQGNASLLTALFSESSLISLAVGL